MQFDALGKPLGLSIRATYYEQLTGYERPVFVAPGDDFEVAFYARWGAVYVKIPPDMSRRKAIKKALGLARQAEALPDFSDCNG